MERPNNVGDREDQSNSNGNEEIQLGSTGNQRNPSEQSWTTKAKYGRDAAILRNTGQDQRKEEQEDNNSRTRAEKVQAQAEYTEANKQVEKSIRTDRKKYVEELAMMAEKAAREGNMKQLYDTTKKLSGKYSKPERPVKDKEGKFNNS
ncbi:unnamed protein product [Schistosoma curassoni]|uniref:NAM-associated domain-containing protein n=1 Tax=Schistosoma curassoni TaxID=6186 RepID=A0A183K4Z8_9TREM|nr:unnamed protein product [Schistosoma curassoni]